MERATDSLAESRTQIMLPGDDARMSGYLQRLTASVMHPRPNVHPLVGPLFSAPQHHGGRVFETDVAERPESYGREGVERQMTAQNTKAGGPGIYVEKEAGPQVPQIVSMPHLSQPAA